MVVVVMAATAVELVPTPYYFDHSRLEGRGVRWDSLREGREDRSERASRCGRVQARRTRWRRALQSVSTGEQKTGEPGRAAGEDYTKREGRAVERR